MTEFTEPCECNYEMEITTPADLPHRIFQCLKCDRKWKNQMSPQDVEREFKAMRNRHVRSLKRDMRP